MWISGEFLCRFFYLHPARPDINDNFLLHPADSINPFSSKNLAIEENPTLDLTEM